MNANVVLPSRSTPSPWTGSEEVSWSEVRPGDVVLDRSGSCGACTVLAVLEVRGTPYLSFSCCGGQRPTPDPVPVATPRLSASITEEKPAHPACSCAR